MGLPSDTAKIAKQKTSDAILIHLWNAHIGGMSRGETKKKDGQRVRDAEGWLELGNAAEALSELEQISAGAASSIDALRARYTALASSQQWRFAFLVSEVAAHIFPKQAEPWLWRAHALRAVSGSAAKALEALTAAGTLFPDDSIVLLNLALYESELNHPAEAAAWLKKSRTAAKASNQIEMVRSLAEEDDRLRGLWKSIDKE
jgi:tetratricopeptide (TPR) repeat protein